MAEQGAINIKNPKLADQLAVGDGGLFGKSDKSSFKNEGQTNK